MAKTTRRNPPETDALPLAVTPGGPDEADRMAVEDLIADGPAEQPDDDFAEFFTSPDGDEVQVRIYRVTPKFYNGEEIKGYCGYLPADADPEWLRINHGGGRYRLQKYVNRRYRESRTATISGPPRLNVPSAVAVPAKTTEGLGEIDGLSLDGSDDAFEKRLTRMALRMAMISRLNPPTPASVDNTLLNAVIQLVGQVTKGDGIEKTLGQLKTLTEVLGEMSPKGEGGNGANLMDLAKAGIEAFAAMVKKAPGASIRPQSPPIVSEITERPVAAALAAPEPVKAEAAPVEKFAIAEKCVGYIVGGFLSDPRLEVIEAVELVKMALPPLDEAGRVEFQQSRRVLWNMARIGLDSAVEDVDLHTVSVLQEYFNEIFDKVLEVPGGPDVGQRE